ncbi:MAG: hypothetical protein JO117_07225 [Verrucomicrobia bacterium]|nr:hypothetical protein [Verrucomicrobiota bacterium]MBV9657744.1 hypothetical protein [Verrucomicrobiota bacterium]
MKLTLPSALRWMFYLLLPALAAVAAWGAPDLRTAAGNQALTFAGTPYLHRWSGNDQHEFTPAGQEDLEHWADMVTINYYPSVKDGDGLAATANAVLGNYKAHQATVVRTDSVPRTPEKPAEYLIVVCFTRPDFSEAVFARFKLVGGTRGAAAIYSHREYGQKNGEQMRAWLQKNGPATEKALMNAEQLPPPAP